MDYKEFCAKYHVRLNDQQSTAVQRVNGATLLLAVPGSGKTTVIVARTGYLLHVVGIDPRNILTITFTKAAAREMKERFIKKFGEVNGLVPHFSTINSFCLSVIKTCAREKHITIPELVPNNEPIIRDIARTMMRDYPSDSTIKSLAQSIGKVKNELMENDQIKQIEEEGIDFYQFYHKYKAHLTDNGLMDFDDQLLMANELLDTYPDILARAKKQYRYISLDEAQDTSLVQHRIVQKLVGKDGNIFMVGDEDQSIYGSRGAYPEALLSFESDYNNASIIYMETNFRSDQKIVLAANQFIKRNKERHDKNMHPNSTEEGKISFVPLQDMKSQPHMVFDAIRKALAAKDHTLAILYRNNYSAIPIINLLQKAGLGVRTRDAAGIFLTNFVVRDILTFFRFAKDQTNLQLFRQLYYKLGLYLKSSVVQSIEETMARQPCRSALIPLTHYGRISAQSRQILRYMDELPKMSPLDGIDSILWNIGYMDNWLQRKIDEGASESSLMLKVNILKLVAMEYKTVDEFLTAIDRIRDYQGDPDSNVTLSTIHSSKGLEFDQVVLVDVFNGVLPTISNTKEEKDEEEEARLFYVGATRAKHQLDIVVPNAMFGQALEVSEFLKGFGSST